MTGPGHYRRRLAIDVRGDVADAGIEDDFHHFRVHLRHDGRLLTAISGEAVRFPWVTCPGASNALDRLVGAELTCDAMRRADAFDRFHQCTHQLELALLAIAAIVRGKSRRFDITITDPDASGLQLATVCVDGVTKEHWAMRAGTVVSPAELAGREMRALRSWVETLDAERYERVAVLRRCVQVASGRLKQILPNVAAQVPGAQNACYAFQHERAAVGYFIPESVRADHDGRSPLLAEFP